MLDSRFDFAYRRRYALCSYRMNYNGSQSFLDDWQKTPSRTSLVVDGHAYSFAHIAQHAGAVAAWLTRQAPQPRVGIVATRSLIAYTGILGTVMCGGTYVPINPKTPAARLQGVLAAAQLDALITDATGARACAALERAAQPTCPHLTPDGADANAMQPALAGCTPQRVARPVGPDHLAYIIFTSGTTGSPKGVMVPTSALASFTDYIQSIYNLTSNDRVSQHSEISFDFSVLDIFLAWRSGASLHVVPEASVMAPGRFIQEQGITFWSSVPSVIHFLKRLKMLQPAAFASVRFSFFCGEPLPLAAAQAWHTAAPNSTIDNHYGPTEATVACTMARLDTHLSGQTPAMASIGRPYPHMDAVIVDAQNAVVADGIAGELAIAGPQLARGYLNNPALTSQKFIHLHAAPDVTYYLTGDLALRDTSGSLQHLGRIDNQVKIHGHRIELEDIDSHLRVVCNTDAVATIGWPVDNGIVSGLVAFYADSIIALDDVRSGLKARLPHYMLPQRIIKVVTIPLTINGKTDRKALTALLQNEPGVT